MNEDIAKDYEFDVRLSGGQARGVTAKRLWSQNVKDHNTFDSPERVTPSAVNIAPRGPEIRLQLPAHSVTAYEIQLQNT